MQNDKTTLKDLSIFTTDGTGSVFALIDYATTQEGRDVLRKHIHHPPDTFEKLKEIQDGIKFWAGNTNLWPTVISNGTLVMLEKYFESADGHIAPPSGFSLMIGAFLQKSFNKNQYFFTQFSLSHLSDFLSGCDQLVKILDTKDAPAIIKRELELMKGELAHRLTKDVISVDKATPYKELAHISFKARREMKNMVYRLITNYAKLDAWQSMAKATTVNNWEFPELLPTAELHFEAQGLFHPLLEKPVAYDITFDAKHNFLLLTGANMSGKTTFLRALGVGALMAHLGMGVPARGLRLSFLHGVITNMHVEDNILRGESYFYAEVQRMKHTAQKLLQPESHLVLMDELFKGTNVHDAYECTRAVVEGLLNHPNHLMLLSTHLYEVAQHFSTRPDILFEYFVTNMTADGGYDFTYQLAPGISNDRIGYRILQKEGVIDLLKGRKG